MNRSDIGIVGLGTMGRNLALNLAGRGFSVAVFNPGVPGEPDLTGDFIKAHGSASLSAARDAGVFIRQIETPRRVLLMVKAGEPVDAMINLLLPHLERGDVIIDGGNSRYRDSERRQASLEERGLCFVGCGISGGSAGALKGPALMPGGSAQAWERLQPLFRSMAAKLEDGTPCCAWMGPRGSGHFVKMVHNGIEYAVMQAIAETYDMLTRVLRLDADTAADIFSGWNGGPARGFLLGIVPGILRHREAGIATLDMVLDSAGQKGTGRDAVMAALDLGVPAPAPGEAVFARFLSVFTGERGRASRLFPGPAGNVSALSGQIEDALTCSMAVSYAQGFSILRAASAAEGWDLDFRSIAHTWRGGCIIQSAMMGDIETVFAAGADTANILTEPPFRELISLRQEGWRGAVCAAVMAGVPVPLLASSLAYFDGYRSERLPANLLQAMRDCFGSHGYERADAPRGALFHTEWMEHDENS